jgi:hypothetical protein
MRRALDPSELPQFQGNPKTKAKQLSLKRKKKGKTEPRLYYITYVLLYNLKKLEAKCSRFEILIHGTVRRWNAELN